MTSASELFHNRRSRAGRNPELGLDPLPLDRDTNLRLLRRRNGHRNQNHREDCDPSRRSHGGPPHARHICHRVSQTERESVRLDRSGPSESGIGNSSSGGTTSSRVSRLRLLSNDQLPGAVLQARARLLERLRGVTLTATRQAITSSGISWDELVASGEFGVTDTGDWETESLTDWFESGITLTDSSVQADTWSFQNLSKKKPLGLSLEAVCSLKREVFKDAGESGVMRASLECCICLERYRDGDGLIRLPCEHQFHCACLEPWVRTCGDCPYCRASIVS